MLLDLDWKLQLRVYTGIAEEGEAGCEQVEAGAEKVGAGAEEIGAGAEEGEASVDANASAAGLQQELAVSQVLVGQIDVIADAALLYENCLTH